MVPASVKKVSDVVRNMPDDVRKVSYGVRKVTGLGEYFVLEEISRRSRQITACKLLQSCRKRRYA